MIVIDGFWWFVGSLVICGCLGYVIWEWRREARRYAAWWCAYDAEAAKRHNIFMAAIGVDDHATGVDETKYCTACGHELARTEDDFNQSDEDNNCNDR